MIADQNFYDMFYVFFYPTASATAEDENCANGPTLLFYLQLHWFFKFHFSVLLKIYLFEMKNGYKFFGSF